MSYRFRFFRSSCNLMRPCRTECLPKKIDLTPVSVNFVVLVCSIYVLKVLLSIRLCSVLLLFAIPVFGSIDIFSSASLFNQSKMITSRVISIFIMAQVVMSETKEHNAIIRICGTKLSDMIRMMCKDTGFVGPFEFNNSGGRGVADECCVYGCSLSTIELYCAASPTQYSSKSAVKRTTTYKEQMELMLNSLHSMDLSKRELDIVAMGEDIASISNSISTIGRGPAEPRANEDRKNNEETERILLRELSQQGGHLIKPQQQQQQTQQQQQQQQQPRERVWHSEGPAAAVSPNSALPPSDSSVTNSVPNLSSDFRESSSAQQTQRSSSLSNDLISTTSSTSKRPTHPPLQIGVQTPYFLGKQLIQPKTRHQQDSESSKNALTQNES